MLVSWKPRKNLKSSTWKTGAKAGLGTSTTGISRVNNKSIHMKHDLAQQF